MEFKKLTLDKYLMDREKNYPITEEMHKDALSLLNKINQLLEAFGDSRIITSGYRPAAINDKIANAAKHSNHMICRAVDLSDEKGDLDSFCMRNTDLLEKLDLWLESPMDTPGWSHLQIVPPHSGHRIFIA